MPTVSENNKRIAKNTLFLYFRQLLVMAVSLYTVRVVLAELGAEDYGDIQCGRWFRSYVFHYIWKYDFGGQPFYYD